MQRRRSGLVLLVWTMGCAWLGCNALLGNESAIFEPDGGGIGDETGSDTGRPGDDGSSSLDGSSLDGSMRPPMDAADADVPDVIVHPCTDTTSDPFNCGACGHDCLGGACSVSKCLPFVVANEPGEPTALAVDGTHVYWTNATSGDVRRAPITGGIPETIWDGPTGTFLGEGLVRSGTDVYFTIGELDGGVFRCPATGCGATAPKPVVAPLAAPGFVGLADGGVLLVSESVDNGRVGSCKLPCASGLDFVASSEGFPSYVATGEGAFYWSTILPGGGNLRARLDDASAPRTLVPSQQVQQMELTTNEVLYAVRGVGIKAVPRDGGSVRRVFDFSQTERLAVDGTVVYYNDSVPLGRILRCPVAGCEAGTPIASSQIHPHAIVIDKTSVYWTNVGDGNAGTIMRIAK
jgi:hypothetical protein